MCWKTHVQSKRFCELHVTAECCCLQVICIIKENRGFLKNITSSRTDARYLGKGPYLSAWVLSSSLQPQILLLSSENNIFSLKAIWVQLETGIQQQKTLTTEKRIVNNGLIPEGSWNCSCWKRETFYSINFCHFFLLLQKSSKVCKSLLNC